MVSLRLTDTVWMEFSQAVLDFNPRDLRGADGGRRGLWEREFSSQARVGF